MSNTLKFGNGEWYGKKDTVLAYNDENSNFKPLPFSFDRASSATVINKEGLIETVGSGEPRIDYKDDSKGALLLEPTRSNLITNSNNLTTWNGAAMTRTLVDDLINPSNGLDASKLTQTSSGGYAWLSRTFTGNETFSAFVKKDSSNFVRLYAANNTVYFDIVNGTIETEIGSDITNKSIINYGNGWFRVSMSVNSTAASYLRIYPASSGSSSSGTNSLFVYGAQLEQGSYATSYIPTSGGVVTRNQDSCEQTVPSGIIGQTEGTVYFETEINGLQGGDMRFQLSDGSTNNWIFISSGEATGIGVKCRAYINNGNVNQFNAYSEYLSAGKHKYALAYKQNDIALYVDGVQVALDTSATIPSCNEITLAGSTPTSTNSSHFLKYDDLKLYNTRLSNAELQALTTL